MHKRINHIDVRLFYRYLRDCTSQEVLKLVFSGTEEHVEDIMTKPLKLGRHLLSCEVCLGYKFEKIKLDGKNEEQQMKINNLTQRGRRVRLLVFDTNNFFLGAQIVATAWTRHSVNTSGCQIINVFVVIFC